MSRRFRLLIVDDSPVALSFLRAVLQSTYDVETADDGDEALEKALADAPDLIVTDSMMPNVDGFELIRRLRDHSKTAPIPVVMLTSSETTDDDTYARTPHPDAMLRKSTSIDPLLHVVRELLRARRSDGPDQLA